MKKILSPALLSAALVAATAFPASALFNNDIRPQVEQKLGKLGVSDADVDKISILPRRRSGNATSIITGYNATVSFHNCDGHLAIRMNPVGDIKDVYNRSGCNFPGVPSY